MTIYIVLYIIIILCSFLEIDFSVIKCGRVEITTRKFSFVILYMFILLMGIIRSEALGVDTQNYRIYYFERYKQQSLLEVFNSNGDVGYNLINKVIAYFTDDYWLFRAILFVITFSIFAVYLYKRTEIVSISFFVYVSLGFLGVDFCVLRQAIAIAICFCGFEFVKNKRLVAFIVTVLIASLFHSTAILCLVMYPLVNFKFNSLGVWKRGCFILGAFLVSAYFMPYIVRSYQKMDYTSYMVRGEGFGLLVFYCVIMLVCAYFMKDSEEKYQLIEEFDASMGIIYFQIGALFFSLFTRATKYWSILLVLLIPNLIKKTRKKKIAFVIFLIMMSFMYFYFLYVNDTRIVPYMSIFD